MALEADLDELQERLRRAPGDADSWSTYLAAAARAGRLEEGVARVSRCLTRAGATPARDQRFLELLARVGYAFGDPRFQFVRSPRGHTFGHLQLSPRGRWVAVLALPRRLDVLEGEGCARVACLPLEAIPGRIFFSEDEETLILGYSGRGGEYVLEHRSLPDGAVRGRYEVARPELGRLLEVWPGGRAVVSDRDGALELVEVLPGGRLSRTPLSVHEGGVQALHAAPSGRAVLVESRLGPERTGDAGHLGQGGTLAELVELHPGASPRELRLTPRSQPWAWSPDGDRLATLEPGPGRESSLVLLAPEGPSPLWTRRVASGTHDRRGWVGFAAGGEVVLAGTPEHLAAHASSDGAQLWSRDFPHASSRSFAVGARASRVAVAHLHAYELRDTTRGEVVAGPIHPLGLVREVRVSGDGARVALLAEEGDSALFDLRSGALLGRFDGEHLEPAPDLRAAVRWTPGRGLAVVDLPSGVERRPLGAPLEVGRGLQVRVAPGGERALVRTEDQPEHLAEIDLRDGSLVRSSNPLDAPVRAFGWVGDPPGTRWALGGPQGEVLVYLEREGRGSLRSVASWLPFASPPLIQGVRGDPTPYLMAPRLLLPLPEHGPEPTPALRLSGDVTCWALHPRGEEVAVYGEDDQLRILGLADRRPRVTLRPEHGAIRSMTYTPDGAWLVYSQACHARLLARDRPGEGHAAP